MHLLIDSLFCFTEVTWPDKDMACQQRYQRQAVFNRSSKIDRNCKCLCLFEQYIWMKNDFSKYKIISIILKKKLIFFYNHATSRSLRVRKVSIFWKKIYTTWKSLYLKKFIKSWGKSKKYLLKIYYSKFVKN